MCFYTRQEYRWCNCLPEKVTSCRIPHPAGQIFLRTAQKIVFLYCRKIKKVLIHSRIQDDTRRRQGGRQRRCTFYVLRVCRRRSRRKVPLECEMELPGRHFCLPIPALTCMIEIKQIGGTRLHVHTDSFAKDILLEISKNLDEALGRLPGSALLQALLLVGDPGLRCSSRRWPRSRRWSSCRK